MRWILYYMNQQKALESVMQRGRCCICCVLRSSVCLPSPLAALFSSFSFLTLTLSDRRLCARESRARPSAFALTLAGSLGGRDRIY